MFSKTCADPPEVLELFEVIARLKTTTSGYSGVIVRSVATKYASINDFFSGTGAAISGGRWNPVGLEAVYASLDIVTATCEAYQTFISFGLPNKSIRPRVMAAAEVSLGAVLDLTSSSTRRKLGFTLKDLVEEDWRAIQATGEQSWTQTIGRGCYQTGFEGLLVPSAQYSQGRNIVMFPSRFMTSSELTILASEDLK